MPNSEVGGLQLQAKKNKKPKAKRDAAPTSAFGKVVASKKRPAANAVENQYVFELQVGTKLRSGRLVSSGVDPCLRRIIAAIQRTWTPIATQGAVDIAVIDTGADWRLFDENDPLVELRQYDLLKVDRDWDHCSPDPRVADFCGDEDGHGSHVAGIIAQIARHANKKVVIHAFRVLRGVESDAARPAGFIQVFKAIQFASQQLNCSVINLSLGEQGNDQEQNMKLILEEVQAMQNPPFLCCAVGNKGLHLPAIHPARLAEMFTIVIPVGAHDKYNKTWEGNQQGTHRLGLGVGVLSCTPSGFHKFSGTSMATAVLSGVRALYLPPEGYDDTRSAPVHL